MSAVDVTWLMGLVFIWSTIEPAVASRLRLPPSPRTPRPPRPPISLYKPPLAEVLRHRVGKTGSSKERPLQQPRPNPRLWVRRREEEHGRRRNRADQLRHG